VTIDQGLIDACTHCGFCLPTCPTYGPLWQMEADSPRGRLWLMRGLADGTLTLNATVVEHIDRCLGCMACTTACPSGVRYDVLLEQTRELIEEEYDREPADWLQRRLVFSVFPHPRRLRLALAVAPPKRFPLPRRLRPLPDLVPPWPVQKGPPAFTAALGEKRGRVGLLTGCVQRVLFGDVNAATARVLAAEGFDVVAPGDQRCCGALHLHAGRREEGHRRARSLGERFAREGVDTVVVNAAGCGSHLKDAGLDVRIVDVSELLAETVPRAERHPLPLRVAFQDSCHLLHAQRIRDAPREILGRISGLELAEPAEQAICCGSAGIYNLVEPEAATELGDRKAGHVAATGAHVYASANPGCLVQVSAALRRAGTPVPAVHPVELLDASIRGLPAAELLTTARR
jgi:glycolate dehydrogenase iron-sulfur subunit